MKHPLPFLTSSLALLIVSLTLAACLYSWLTLLEFQEQQQQNRILQVEAHARQLNESATQSFSAILRSADTALKHLRSVYVRNRYDFDRTVMDILATYPEGMLQFVTVFDSDGYLAYASNGASERLFFGDREHFRVHLDGGKDELFISKPIIGRLSGLPLIQLTRSIRDGNRLVGVIGLPLRPDYLSRQLGSLQINPQDSISIVRSDGSFIARSRKLEEALNTQVPMDRPFMKAEPQQQGQYRAESIVDRRPLLFNWRRLAEWPVNVVATVDEDAELAIMKQRHELERRRTMHTLFLLNGLALGFAVLLVRIGRQSRKLAQRESLYRATSIRLQHLLRGAGDGIHVLDAQGNVVEVSDAFCRMLGYTREQLIGMNLSHWESTIKPAAIPGTLARIFTQNQAMVFESRHRRQDGSFLDVEISAQHVKQDGQDLLFASARDISERRRAAAALEQSRRELQAVQKLANMGDWQWDLTTGQHVWSEQIYMMYRRHPEQGPLSFTEQEAFFTPESWTRLTQAMERCRLFGESYAVDAEMYFPDDARRWIIIFGEAVQDQDGQIAKLRGMAQDITERKLAELTLERRERELQQAQAVAHIGSWRADIATGALGWSDEIYRIFGLEPASPLNFERFLEYIPAHERRQVKLAWEAALRGEPYDIIHPVVIGDQIKWVRERGEFQFDDERRPLYGIGTSQDITEVIRSQRQVVNLLEEQQAMLQSQTVGIAKMSDQKLVWTNSAMATMLGYTPEELANQPIRMIYPSDHVHTEFGEQAQAAMQAGQVYRTQAHFLHKDGSLHWFDVSVARLSTGTHESMWALVNMDARKQFEAELVEARRAAEAANQAKSRFLATMSHEIRTPLNGILGMAQVLLAPDLNEVERQDYARTILSSGQALLTLLNDILDLSKVEAGRFELRLTAFSPAALLEETRALFVDAAEHKGLQLAAQWLGPDEYYQGDPHRLRQMLANLVGNALKFTTQGQIMMEAREIRRASDRAMLEFTVSDTGTGIHPDQQTQLFQPFVQLDNSNTRQFGGTGLGLSIVRSLAQLMGGEVGVHSAVGQGSRFWWTISAPLAAPVSEIATEPVPAATPRRIRGGRSVLVVEDHPANQQVITTLLRMLGIDYTLVEHGQAALDHITQGHPAGLILMDLHMPVMDGYIATARLREWEQAHELKRRPVIALTADVFTENRQRCLDIGMDDVLTKPIDVEILQTVLTRWLPLTPAIAAPEMALDKPKIMALVDELSPLLQHHRFDAMTRYRQLTALVAETKLAAPVAAMGRELEAFHFDLAFERLQRLKSVLNGDVLHD